jgi:hypothetical protein
MLRKKTFSPWMLSLLILLSAVTAFAQTTAKILGSVTDATGAAVAGAQISVKNPALGIERTTQTNSSGGYEVPALPPGKYNVQVATKGFETQLARDVVLEVSNNVVQNFSLKVASTNEVVTVEATAPVIEATTMTVGQTINQRTVQELPLNGRHFVDLALLIPGTVTAPQNGFLTAPLRGQGAFAVNTAGMREDAVNWMVNGINLNDMVQNQVTFQPTINTVSEFKVDNSTYSAEYGRNAGAIVTIASRSGANNFHGELYDYIRNDFFDARNAFNRVTTSTGAPNPISPFKRNQFGGDFGGPIVKEKTFFFATYEGERHRQGIATSTLVFPDSSSAPCTGAGSIVTRACIAAAGNPISNALMGLVPHANSTQGTSPVPNAFLGSATAPVNIDQGTIDINHNFNEGNRLHGYFVYQHDLRQEATAGTTIPNFGDTREGKRLVFTLGDTHVFTSSLVNEANIGVNRIHITFTPNNTTDPNSLGLGTVLGPNERFMPTINITNGALFGSERNFPQGRGDTTVVFADNLSYVRGRHSFKFGTEFRDFRNANFNNDPGQLLFSSPTSFMNGAPDSSARTLGAIANRVTQNALDFYAMDSFKFKPYLTVELGVRYAWNMTPSEASDRFVNFVPGGATGSMLVPVTEPYAQNNKNFQPRVGFAWDVLHNGKTVMRAGYAYQVDEPITGIVTGLINNNSNFATPISVGTSKTFAATSLVYNSPVPTSISPTVVDPNFKDANVQSWNLNIQQQITNTASVMAGYFGNKGTHLENDINLNQTTRLGTVGPGSQNPLTNNAFLPFQTLSPSSPFFPGVGLASFITERQSGSNSIYNALWVSATQRTSHGLQFNGSYTYAHSIDEASRNLQGVIFQDSTNIFASRSNSDFDVRHRFVANAIYDLPFKGNIFVSGWEAAPVVSWQTGNPFTIVLNNSSAINGVSNTVNPTVSGPVHVSGNPLGQWISNPGVFIFPQTPNTFGNLRRNSVYGPGFTNVDFSLAKNTKIREKMTLQFRVDAFDLFNHPNYGQPGPQSGGSLVSVLTPTAGGAASTFSTISGTRFPTGDSGSSRQLQMALKLQF